MTTAQAIEKNNPSAIEMATMSNEALASLIQEHLSISVRSLVTIAAALRILEDRGADIGEMKLTMLGYLRKIAHGQLLPELVVRFQGHPRLLSRVAALPMPDQEKVKAAQALCIIEMNAEGTTARRMVPPESMETSQLAQVFGRDGIRGENDQILYLKAGLATRRATAPANGVLIDRRGKAIVVNGYRLTLAELAEYVSRLSK